MNNESASAMQDHRLVWHEEWLAARHADRCVAGAVCQAGCAQEKDGLEFQMGFVVRVGL